MRDRLVALQCHRSQGPMDNRQQALMKSAMRSRNVCLFLLPLLYSTIRVYLDVFFQDYTCSILYILSSWIWCK